MKFPKLNVFDTARIKLTVYYLAIIVTISILFSLIIYGVVARQIERLIRPRAPWPDFINREIVEEQKIKLVISLVWINSGVWAISAVAGYFLAGRTLDPIKEMVEEQNQFISDASHELRTPIATLKTEMEAVLMEKKLTDKSARAVIESNLEELNRLQGLTERILQLTRTHKTGEKILLKDVVSLAVKNMTPTARVKNIKIQGLEIQENEKVDKRLLEILIILLDNAIKYSPKNSSVMVKSDKNDNRLKVVVSDQGIGIDDKDLPHVFDRFYRGDKSRSETSGYGLGLSIAKKLTEELGGKILAVSASGKGSKFTIELPL